MNDFFLMYIIAGSYQWHRLGEVAWLQYLSLKYKDDFSAFFTPQKTMNSLSTCTSYIQKYSGNASARYKSHFLPQTQQHWKPSKGKSPVPSHTQVYLSFWERFSVMNNEILMLLSYTFSHIDAPQIKQRNQSTINFQCGFQQTAWNQPLIRSINC